MSTPRLNHLIPGPVATCQCGVCKCCTARLANRRYYLTHKAIIVPKDSVTKRRRNCLGPVSDAELDRRALAMGGCG
jgi:hypothetical protein